MKSLEFHREAKAAGGHSQKTQSINRFTLGHGVPSGRTLTGSMNQAFYTWIPILWMNLEMTVNVQYNEMMGFWHILILKHTIRAKLTFWQRFLWLEFAKHLLPFATWRIDCLESSWPCCLWLWPIQLLSILRNPLVLLSLRSISAMLSRGGKSCRRSRLALFPRRLPFRCHFVGCGGRRTLLATGMASGKCRMRGTARLHCVWAH